jgi:DNA-binding GntR family transcriptional regulator
MDSDATATALPDELPNSGGQLRRPASLVEDVYHRVRDDIMSLKIAPNARITVDSLARELGVSQTPIREALSMLEAAGLVRKQRFVGYCAAPTLNRKQFQDLYEVRLLLEPFAARRAAEKMSEPQLLELHQLTLHMDPDQANMSRGSYDLFADRDAEFHALIAQGGGNELIAQALARLHTHLHIFRLRFHPEITNEAYLEHSQIIGALRHRAPSDAEAAMRSHIEKSYERLVKCTQE